MKQTFREHFPSSVPKKDDKKQKNKDIKIRKNRAPDKNTSTNVQGLKIYSIVKYAKDVPFCSH